MIWSVPSHGEPAAHGQQPALVVLPHQVVQHRAVVDEGVQIPDQKTEVKRYKDSLLFLFYIRVKNGLDDLRG